MVAVEMADIELRDGRIINDDLIGSHEDWGILMSIYLSEVSDDPIWWKGFLGRCSSEKVKVLIPVIKQMIERASIVKRVQWGS